MAGNSASPNFQIITTLRYDPVLAVQGSGYYLLPYHYDRLLSAATDFQWTQAITTLQERGQEGLLDMLDGETPSQLQPWRIRVLVNQHGNITSEFAPLEARASDILLPTLSNDSHSFNQGHPPPAWVLRLDSKFTPPSRFTRHKTTNREAYNVSRERAGINSPQQTVEVLIYSPTGEVMEGSITTPYFKRSRRQPGDREVESGLEDVWVTPPLSSGGNAGTTRRYALAQGLCVEEVVGIDDLVNGEDVWLSNSVRGFVRAVLQLA
ncbi:Aminodeoxychorismate lyase [Ophidiomyces ophidiicola]|nr:Aminodeoxychorismate lyase [Ophidiomyces ophidiicola]